MKLSEEFVILKQLFSIYQKLKARVFELTRIQFGTSRWVSFLW